MEIMFEDLNPDAQERLLVAAGVSRPEDMDWDEMPVAVVEFEEDDYDFEEDDEYVEDIGDMYDEEDDYYD